MWTRLQSKGLTVGYPLTFAVLTAVGAATGRPFRALPLTLPTGVIYFILQPFLEGWLGRMPLAEAAMVVALGLANVFVLRKLIQFLPPANASVRAGVEQHLAHTLVASGLEVTPVPRSHGKIRTEDGALHQEHSLLLRDLPMSIVEVVAALRDTWQSTGYQVTEHHHLDSLQARDDKGFELRLTAAPPNVILQAISPPADKRGFVPGLIASLTPQALLCLTAILLVASASDGLDPVLYGLFPLIGGSVAVAEVSIVVGLVLCLGVRTRKFGQGLLLGSAPGALVALAFLGIRLF